MRNLTAKIVGAAAFLLAVCRPDVVIADGVFVRFKLVEPAEAKYYLKLGGYIHNAPWYLKPVVLPGGADRNAGQRYSAGQWTDWFDVKAYQGGLLHGRKKRAGGVAEFPNVTVEWVTGTADQKLKVAVELAASPGGRAVKRIEETIAGHLTSFLVSPSLEKDKDDLESDTEMTARRLKWAREASDGKRVSPKQLIVQTSFWAPQRPELNVQEAEVLWLLGFNTVGGQAPDVHAKFPDLRIPGHTHQAYFGPNAAQTVVDAAMRQQAERNSALAPGVPFGFSDEICCNPRIGKDTTALKRFHEWLAARGIAPKKLGVEKLEQVEPIETPEAFREKEQGNGPAARRVFYYTSRFRQEAGSESIRWHTDAVHKYFTNRLHTTTLVADHPYFGGTGLGMGMEPNTAWGGAPLALDWFDMARKHVVDIPGVEDWMGLQYMYGPRYTWEGFQLMGFQAAIFRSGSRGEQSVIAWITPSDEINLRLKSASALCQGAKHFFYWTYGPTATSTENYWSDLRGEYDGIVHVVRQLAAAEHIIAPGRTRPTRVALLYSVSADLWQPYGYIHMLERRATYLALVHDRYLVDMLTEEDIEGGRLADYTVLYATDPCIALKAADAIAKWVKSGGRLYGACGAGSRDEFNEPAVGLAEVFGIGPALKAEVQEGEYRVRGNLNHIGYTDEITFETNVNYGAGGVSRIGVLGVKAEVKPAGAAILGRFKDGAPALTVNRYGKGQTIYFAACPGLAYLKEAKFVPEALKEQYPDWLRGAINAWARDAGVAPLCSLSTPVVEAGVFDAPAGSALILANFTYEPIRDLRVGLPMPREPKRVVSVERGALKFETAPRKDDKDYPAEVRFKVDLDINDVIMLE